MERPCDLADRERSAGSLSADAGAAPRRELHPAVNASTARRPTRAGLAPFLLLLLAALSCASGAAPADASRPNPPSQPTSPSAAAESPWWVRRAPQRPPVPSKTGTWGRNEIDRFIQAAWAPLELSPTQEAPRTTLIRRLYLDLLGLPPTPEAVKSFEQDPAADAYERLVDSLLDAPAYGEHWARHWLDLVRYADSDGYRVDDFRPNAWRYREYVIRSLNQDKPYDRFVQEQLAGDELWPEDPEALIATGFLRHGIYEYNNRDAEGQWSTILNDITDTTAEVFLGVGLQCARCHDHKFDPLPQSDYFRFQAFFSALLPQEDMPVATPRERAAYNAKLDQWLEKTASIREQIREIEGPRKQSASDELRSKFPPEIQALMRKPIDQRSPYEHQIAELAYRQITYAYERLSPRLKPEEKEKLSNLRKQLSEFDSLLPAPLPMAMIASDLGPTAPPTRIPRHPEIAVEPGFLSVLAQGAADVAPLPQAPHSTGRRAALARWMTQPNHPLAPRVLVNRVWQYHFGKGLVATSSDFGRLGEAPSHPELLDWLADEFVRKGWSLKHLHRKILTSGTYRQSATPSEEGPVEATRPSARTSSLPPTDHQASEAAHWHRGQTVDPENRFWWHGPARRLGAEQIRDAVLQASGELKLGSPGPPVDASKPYRSIYTKVLRNTRDPLLDAFDAPQNFTSTCNRDATTTPIQSLLLLNGNFMLERARAIAARIEVRFPKQLEEQIRAAYQTLFGRLPSGAEMREAQDFLAGQIQVIDPELAASAAASFVSGKMPYREGRAAVMQLKGGNGILKVPLREAYPAGALTIEGFVILRSVAEDAAPRVLLTAYGATAPRPLWSLVVTGRKFAGKPQTLALEVSRPTKATSSVAASELTIRLDRPYFVAASLDPVAGLVTFHTKDLSNDDEPLASAAVPLTAAELRNSVAELALGGNREGTLRWDGLLDDLRVSRGIVPIEHLELRELAIREETLGYWPFEPKPGYFKDKSRLGNDIEWRAEVTGKPLTAESLALGDLCHALLNSNEFLYVE